MRDDGKKSGSYFEHASVVAESSSSMERVEPSKLFDFEMTACRCRKEQIVLHCHQAIRESHNMGSNHDRQAHTDDNAFEHRDLYLLATVVSVYAYLLSQLVAGTQRSKTSVSHP